MSVAAQIVSNPALRLGALPCFCGLIALVIFLLIGSYTMPHVVWACGALAHYALVSLFVLRFYPAGFVLLLWFLFSRFGIMLSGAVVENGALIKELGLYGEATGAFIRLELMLSCILVILAVGITAGLNRIQEQTLRVYAPFRSWSVAALMGIAAFCLVGLALGIKHGFPALEGIDRVVYWRAVDSQLLLSFLSNRPIIAALAGLICGVSLQSKSYNKTGWAAFGMMVFLIMLSLLFAEKFTSLIMMGTFFVIPIFLLYRPWLETLGRRVVVLTIMLGMLSTAAILNVYGFAGDRAGAVERFQMRAAAQGQLWYVQDRQQNPLFKMDADRLSHNAKSLASLNPQIQERNTPYLGVRDFMDAHLQTDRYRHYLERGITLTMGAEAYLLKLFGSLGMVAPYMVLLSVYAAGLLYLAYGVYSHNPLRIILATKLLIWMNFGLSQGFFYYILGAKALAFIALIIAFEMFLRSAFKPKASA